MRREERNKLMYNLKAGGIKVKNWTIKSYFPHNKGTKHNNKGRKILNNYSTTYGIRENEA